MVVYNIIVHSMKNRLKSLSRIADVIQEVKLFHLFFTRISNCNNKPFHCLYPRTHDEVGSFLLDYALYTVQWRSKISMTVSVVTDVCG